MGSGEGKTYLLVRDTPLTDFVLAPIHDDSRYVVLSHHRERGVIAKIKRFLSVTFPGLAGSRWARSIFGDEYTRRLHDIGPEDKVILFDIRNLKDTQLLKREIHTPHITSFLWDPMSVICRGSEKARMQYIKEVNKLGVEVATFDPDDARECGFKYVGAVYRDISRLKGLPEETDFWYIGTEKYREEPLEALAAEIEDAGLRYTFKIVPHKHKSRLDNFKHLRHCVSAPLPYEQSLEKAARARCLIDLVQRRQSGVTLRAMEAIFLDKKLITNNAAIKREAYYHPANVYILGDPAEQRTLREFMDTPMVALSPAILSTHDITRWLPQL